MDQSGKTLESALSQQAVAVVQALVDKEPILGW